MLHMHTKFSTYEFPIPSRPLPRGLLKYDDVVVAIKLVLAAMTLYAVIMGIFFSPAVGVTFGIQVMKY